MKCVCGETTLLFLSLSQLYDITQHTNCQTGQIDAAQPEQRQMRFGQLLKTVWTVGSKNQISEGI